MKKSIYIGLGIFIVLILIGIIFFNLKNENNSIKNIQIDAKWFEFNPNLIKIKQGDRVTLLINNLDVPHGITIPELGISGNEAIMFTADKKGEYIFYCNNFCGEGHSKMVGKIIVE